MTLFQNLPTAKDYRVTGSGILPSAFAVSELANASFASVGQQMAQLMQATGLANTRPEVTVDQRLASLWFGYSFRAIGWELPDLWDPIAGNYETKDGWIRLHTNLAHHRAAALAVLECQEDREAVQQAVRTWEGDVLETAIASEGGVSAKMRSRAEWQAHPQGQALSKEPLIHWGEALAGKIRAGLFHDPKRPLDGLRVLDLTRVLAGPIATRTLAGFGAEVLRIDPPGWDEPGVIQDISLGKNMASLDLKTEAGLTRLKELAAKADVLVHGYRPDALERLGFGTEIRRQIAPQLVDVSLDAYGWTGPWAARRGFDSLVQMSCGIADAGRNWAKASEPTPLPVQALDHATGYLMAAAVLCSLRNLVQTGQTQSAKLSLARTAEHLASLQNSGTKDTTEISSASEADFSAEPEFSSWGPGQRLQPALELEQCQMHWSLPAQCCGSSISSWRS
ncbi:CaiB/BaiF family protein [Roseobacter sp. SK209-2-6]|uniref:CoA transferase n=1 Tax=Roseobacter sp. SK209-2-6 TaxID=388739 RepID=UPI0000F3C785|nr:CoA transferase [Roseobacter sp. SK209-2-6]EBA18197.1 CaiB/BaiF family protein [Roseobacter sp. SK209-2-6]